MKKLFPLVLALALSLPFVGCKKDKTDPTPATPTVPAPIITTLSLTSGPIGEGVTITGTNLGGATAVTFNGKAATFTPDSSTAIIKLKTTVPVGATSGNVTVTTPGGTSNGIGFTIQPMPTLTELLTRRNWQLKALTSTPPFEWNGFFLSNVLAIYNACGPQNSIYQLEPTGVYTVVKLCDPAITGTWALNSTQTELTTVLNGASMTYKITELTPTTLKYQYTMFDGWDTFTYAYMFKNW